MKPKLLMLTKTTKQLPINTKPFEESGCDFFMISFEQSSLEKIETLQPDIMIIHWESEKSPLLTLCSTLKNNIETRPIPILVLSSVVSMQTQKQLFQLGVEDYLPFPITSYLLLARVTSLLHIKKEKEEFKVRKQALSEKRKRLKLQLKTAMEIQRSLIPEYSTTIHDIQIKSRYLPASDVGGDFYEVINLNDHAIGILMADVSGHGISAALLTSMLKLLFRSTVEHHPRPDALLEKMNQAIWDIFSDSQTDVYACAFFAYIDTKAQKITYCNAGHTLPLLFDNSSQKTVTELTSSGIPLGLMEKTVYTCSSVYYNKGNGLIFYTDGLSDFLYKNDNDKFLVLLKELIQKTPERNIQKNLLNKIIQTFCTSSTQEIGTKDDVSLILCKL